MAVNESNAGFKPDHASDISRFCYRHTEDLKVCPKELTMDDVAAIGLYTLGFEKTRVGEEEPLQDDQLCTCSWDQRKTGAC